VTNINYTETKGDMFLKVIKLVKQLLLSSPSLSSSGNSSPFPFYTDGSYLYRMARRTGCGEQKDRAVQNIQLETLTVLSSLLF